MNDNDTISDKANGSQLYICTNNDENGFFKLTKLNYATLCPSNFEKPKVSLTLDLEFNDKKDFAVFVHMITQLWNCLKIKAK